MPLPTPKQAEPRQREAVAEPSYHFESAYGDVAALHAQIERSFAETPFAALPRPVAPERLEAAVQILSRAAGPTLLMAGIAGIAFVLF